MSSWWKCVEEDVLFPWESHSQLAPSCARRGALLNCWNLPLNYLRWPHGRLAIPTPTRLVCCTPPPWTVYCEEVPWFLSKSSIANTSCQDTAHSPRWPLPRLESPLALAWRMVGWPHGIPPSLLQPTSPDGWGVLVYWRRCRGFWENEQLSIDALRQHSPSGSTSSWTSASHPVQCSLDNTVPIQPLHPGIYPS